MSSDGRAKRYERMMKANGLHQSQAQSGSSQLSAAGLTTTAGTSSQAAAAAADGTKKQKRKRDKSHEGSSQVDKKAGAIDGDAGDDAVRPTKKPKTNFESGEEGEEKISSGHKSEPKSLRRVKVELGDDDLNAGLETF